MAENILAFVAAVMLILVIATDHTYANHGYEFRLTNKDRHVVMVKEFPDLNTCQSARDIAMYFGYYGTCTPV